MSTLHLPNQYVYNPITKRDVKINGKAHKKMLADVAAGWVASADGSVPAVKRPREIPRKTVVVPKHAHHKPLYGRPRLVRSKPAIPVNHNYIPRAGKHGPTPQAPKKRKLTNLSKQLKLNTYATGGGGSDEDGFEDDAAGNDYEDDQGDYEDEDLDQQYETGQYQDDPPVENYEEEEEEEGPAETEDDDDEDSYEEEEEEEQKSYPSPNAAPKKKRAKKAAYVPLEEHIPGHTTGGIDAADRQVDSLLNDHGSAIQKAYEKHGNSTQFVHFLNSLI